MTQTWQWKWALRAEPNRCRKETAPIWARGLAPGLARRSVERMARRKMRSTELAMAGLWWRKGRIRALREAWSGTDSTH
jgi:hypothetical protein